MSKKFEKLFKISRETVGPKEGEKIPSGLKRNAVEAMFLANVVEPQAFQLGAVKMANLILQSEKEGTSRHWMNWLAEEDVAELEKALFDLKNNTHAKHNVNPDPKSVRSQDEMYKLFKNYVSEGNYILQVIEHNVGHIIDVDDIQDILQWVDHRPCHEHECFVVTQVVNDVHNKFLSCQNYHPFQQKVEAN